MSYDALTYRCAVIKHQLLQHCLGQNACLVPLCCYIKKGRNQSCATTSAPIKICYSYRCAINKHHCTAALFRAKCMPCCSVLLCHNKQADDCLVPVHKHLSRLAIHTGLQSPNTNYCSTLWDKMHALFLCAAMPKKAESNLVPLH